MDDLETVATRGPLEPLGWSIGLTTRDKIFAIEARMRRMPPMELPLKHYFSPGVYARELSIPAGTLLTGEIHKYAQLNILSKGTISVFLEGGIQKIEAPFTVVSPPGTKRIAYAHTDCVWTTILGTNETDLAKIHTRFIAKSEQEWLDFCANLHSEDGARPCHS